MSENDYSDPRCYDKPFVDAFKLYLQKRHPDEERLFQTPLQMYSVNDKTWYEKEPMGKKQTRINDEQSVQKGKIVASLYATLRSCVYN